MAGVTAKNLNKIYANKVKAVQDFNLEIKDREFIVLVGPSGCGKSTMLRMIAGLEEITSGELFIDDVLVNSLTPKERDISMVFQNYALYPHMNVYDNMAFGLSLRHVNKDIIRERVTAAASLLGISDLLARKPGQMSGGQQQRVALGRAIVRAPSVFLLDEPLSNLDAKLRNQMRLEIIKLHKQLETTFIYVTHDQTEAMTMADRIVVMDRGEIMQVDTPQNLYNRPANQFVAGFIGTPQMNLIDCTLCKNETGFELNLGDFSLPVEKGRFDESELEKSVDLPMVLGVRSEHILVGQGSHCGVIEIAEIVGSDTYFHILLGRLLLTAKVATGDKVQANTKIAFGIDGSKIHLFNKKTQQAVALRGN